MRLYFVDLDTMRKIVLLICSSALIFNLTACLSKPAVSPEVVNPVPPPFAARLHYPEAWSMFYYGQGRLLAAEGRFDEAVTALEKAVEFDPRSAYLKLSLGRLLLQKDDTEAAIRAVEDALIEDPELLDAHLLLGGIHFNQRNFKAAARHLGDAVQVDPERDSAWLHLGMAHARAGNTDQAIEVFQQFLQRNPESGTGMVHLARSYQAINLPSRAIDIYRDLIRLHPDQLAGYVELGELLEDQERLDEAQAVYLEGIDRVEQAGPLYHSISRVLVQQEQLDEALQFLEEQRKENPEDLEAMRKTGLIYLEQQKWVQASAVFQEILDRRPDLDQIRYYHGTALERQNDWHKAREEFTAIPEDSDLYADALYHRSYLSHQLGEIDLAISQLRQLIDRHDARPEIYDFLASLYEEAGDSAAALRILDDGFNRYPMEVELLYHAGVIFERQNDRESAMEVMLKVLAIEPDHPEALNYLAYGYAEAGKDLPEALKMVNAALASKQAPHIIDTLGWVHYRMGNLDQAREALEQASSELPKDPVIWEHLGDVYRDMGLSVEALQAYGKALELAPDTPGLADKLKQVEP